MEKKALNLKSLLGGIGRTSFDAMMIQDKVKNDLHKMDPYNPKDTLFRDKGNVLTEKEQKIKNLQKKASYDGNMLEIMMKAAMYEGLQNKGGVNSLIKTATGFDTAFRKALARRVAWGVALGSGAALTGALINTAAHAVSSAHDTANRTIAYKKYISDSGIKDTKEERKLFNAAYHMNPHMMSNPVLAEAAIRQIRNYGGFDINMAGSLAKAMPMSKPADMNNAAKTYATIGSTIDANKDTKDVQLFP